MTYDDCIAHWGTQVAMAAAIGTTQGTISKWRNNERHPGLIPELYQFKIESITGGKLKVDAQYRIDADERSQESRAPA